MIAPRSSDNLVLRYSVQTSCTSIHRFGRVDPDELLEEGELLLDEVDGELLEDDVESVE